MAETNQITNEIHDETVNETAPNETAPKATKPANKAAKQKTVKVKIPRVNKKQGDQFVSVNNYTCLIKPGVWVEVPDYVAEVLKHREEMLEIIAEFEAENADQDNKK